MQNGTKQKFLQYVTGHNANPFKLITHVKTQPAGYQIEATMIYYYWQVTKLNHSQQVH